MVGYDVSIVGEPLLAEGAYTILGDNLPIEELPHLAVGSDFSISSWMV
jgi:hypothetical protein